MNDLTRTAVFVVTTALLPLSVLAQRTKAESNAEASALQAARAKSVLRKGSEVHYPPDRFDLSDLPHYTPEQQVSGTIRQWGSNYLTDSPLAGYLESAFQKFQPNVKFADHLRTSEHAITSLVFNVADIGIMGRQIMWDERLAFQREFDYQPTSIIGMTGSYDVSGWNPPIGIFVNAKNPLAHLRLLVVQTRTSALGESSVLPGSGLISLFTSSVTTSSSTSPKRSKHAHLGA